MTVNKFLVWDQTFPALLLKGEGASAFLQGQTTADIFAQTQPESIFLSCWLSTKGSLKALLEIRLSTNMAEVIIISGDINSLKAGFESVIFPADKVKLEIVKPIRRIQVINNSNSWKKSNCQWIDNKIFIKEISKYTKATGDQLAIWKIRQGIPSFNKEINGDTNPFDLGLADTVNLDKGCYLGQEAIARLCRSKSLKYQLRYWEASVKSHDLDIGKKIFNVNQNGGLKKNVGFITSSILVADDFFNGLALIKTKYLDNDFLFSENDEVIAIKKPISFTQPY